MNQAPFNILIIVQWETTVYGKKFMTISVAYKGDKIKENKYKILSDQSRTLRPLYNKVTKQQLIALFTLSRDLFFGRSLVAVRG